MDDDSIDQGEYRYVSEWRLLQRYFPDPDDGDCEIEGRTPWDLWKKWAEEDGVPEELAQLGSQVIRQVYEEAWPYELQRECGTEDHGEGMVWRALNFPEKCRIRWQYLLDSRGDFCWDDPSPKLTGYDDIP